MYPEIGYMSSLHYLAARAFPTVATNQIITFWNEIVHSHVQTILMLLFASIDLWLIFFQSLLKEEAYVVSLLWRVQWITLV
jgi:hypothetical protein